MDRIISLFLVIVVAVTLLVLHASIFIGVLGLVFGVIFVAGGIICSIFWGIEDCIPASFLKFLVANTFITSPGYALCVFCWHHVFV